MYIENPKTIGSGIVCCIPQTGRCRVNCPDCFFQSGRSYLEPLDDNLPNMPSLEEVGNRIVRVNDGNDSLHDIDTVVSSTEKYPLKFYNTSHGSGISDLPGPTVLTVNPGMFTNNSFIQLDEIPENLMYVRVRTNMWNLDVVDKAVDYYTSKNVPVVLTFMAYFTELMPEEYLKYYIERKRTLNTYWAITTEAWRIVMKRYENNVLVYSCGTEGEHGTTKCARCGNCIREFYNTLERIKDA